MRCLTMQIETTPKLNHRAAEEFDCTSEQGQFGSTLAIVLSNKFSSCGNDAMPLGK